MQMSPETLDVFTYLCVNEFNRKNVRVTIAIVRQLLSSFRRNNDRTDPKGARRIVHTVKNGNTIEIGNNIHTYTNKTGNNIYE